MKLKAIDLFAGLGGFSTGAQSAGVDVVWAANHWREAVDIHKANHPDTDHACQDLQQADWSRVPDHDILLASPACQGHSRAKGKERPHHDAMRATAWAVVSAAEAKRPVRLIVENVPEFQKWVLYRTWCDALRVLGYRLTVNLIDAAALGVPSHRQRVFIVGSRDEAVHIHQPSRPHTSFAAIEDAVSTNWTRLGTKAERTQQRAAAGRVEHGVKFLIAYYGSERGGRSIDRPLGAITTKERYALVDGDRMRMISVEETRRAMAFPASYVLPTKRGDAFKMLGNAVAPPAAEYVVRAVAASLA